MSDHDHDAVEIRAGQTRGEEGFRNGVRPARGRYVKADGVEVFYREAGPDDAPVVLLLHGFPASSFQYRELMTLLSGRYRVIAPDLPGFGFTKVPESRGYVYTFANLATTLNAFTEALGLGSFAMYLFDYGAPTGLRLALAHPERVTAIVSQNGNAYEEGLGAGWAPIRQYWKDGSAAHREALRPFLSAASIREQFEDGPHAERVKPEGYTLDAALMERPGRVESQLDLLYDYRTNVALYPKFQAYFRERRPPTLVVWGRHDPFFIPAGAEAFARDNPAAEIHLIEAGHFALETDVEEVAGHLLRFLGVVLHG